MTTCLANRIRLSALGQRASAVGEPRQRDRRQRVVPLTDGPQHGHVVARLSHLVAQQVERLDTEHAGVKKDLLLHVGRERLAAVEAFDVAVLTPRLIELCRAAKTQGLNLTVDAEEAERLELSLEVFARLLAEPSLAGWDGLGLAVQTYLKRAPEAIDWVAEASVAARSRDSANSQAPKFPSFQGEPAPATCR